VLADVVQLGARPSVDGQISPAARAVLAEAERPESA
jgi:hypothetical protein